MASGDSVFPWVDALAGFPPSSNYPQFGTAQNLDFAAFDTTTQETIYFKASLPQTYAGGDVVFTSSCMMQSATSGTASCGISIFNLVDGATDLDAAESFDTETLATPVTVPGTAGQGFTIAVTVPAADMDGAAAGDAILIRWRRDVANDSATGDLRLLGFKAVEA